MNFEDITHNRKRSTYKKDVDILLRIIVGVSIAILVPLTVISGMLILFSDFDFEILDKVFIKILKFIYA